MNKMVKTNKCLKKAVPGTHKKLTNVQKQNPKNLPNIKKTPTKSENVAKFVDNKNTNNKNNNKSYKKKSDSGNNKKSMTIKNDSVTEILVSNLDTSTEVADNDSGEV